MQQRTVKRSEADVLSSCLKYLKAAGIFSLRMNVGGMKQGSRYVRFGVKGCADILALPKLTESISGAFYFHTIPIWIETKSSTGKQSPAQKEFQKVVEAEGHRYIVCRSAFELKEKL